MLSLKHITAGYGSSHVIHDVSLEVAAGEVVCLLGPNGAGKSTVLKAIANIATIHEGKMHLSGRDITRLPTHTLLQAGIAYVPQGRTNFPNMTVRENLEMGGFLLNDRRILEERISGLFARFPVLAKKETYAAASLSGGEGQMLAMARALIMQPNVLLLDEPSLGLAPKTVAELFHGLHAMVEEGMTILLVEQNVHLALELATRGYLLAAGKMVFEGSAEELKNPERMRELYLG